MLLNVGIISGVIIGAIWIGKERHEMHELTKNYKAPQAAPVFGRKLPMPTSSPGLGAGFYAALLGCAVGAFVVVRLLMLLGLGAA